MKRILALRAASLVRIVGVMAVVTLFGLGPTPSFAGDEPTTESQPVLTWGRVYDSYRRFDQLQNIGEGEVVALAATDSADIHLIKFSASGDIVWNRMFGSDYGDYANSLTRTVDGGFLICGYTESIKENGTIRDILLIKTDAEGNLKWRMSYGGSNHEYGWFAWEREDGGYTIFGGILLFHESNDLYVAVTDVSGTVMTEKRFSGSIPLKDVLEQERYKYANGKPTRDGGCIIHTKTGLIKLSSLGDVEWQEDFSSLGDYP
ncbi:MAG: hypothetical protein M1457_04505, partial [bacterium]|nr:hypothetical protein [bacterium]